MVYNYYMKNNIARLMVLAVFGLFPALGSAQGMVVRVDGKKVYLDTTSFKQKVTKGQSFKVILSSEKLVNPKTGNDLGEVHTYSPAGKIIEVQEKYAVGELADTAKIAVGQEAVLEEAAPAAPTAAPAAPAGQEPAATISSRRKIVYEPVEQEIVSLSQADVTAPGAQNIITLSDKGVVTVWSRGEKDTLRQELSYQISRSAQAVVLSAVPVKAGLAQIFVSVYEPSRKTFSTLVLENQNNALVQTDKLPYFMKEVGCGTDKKLWAQTPFATAGRPGSAREVTYADGQITAEKPTVSTQRNWLSGVNFYEVEKPGDSNLIYTSANGTIRLSTAKGKRAESKDLFAKAPNRVKYKQEIVDFYPSVQVFGPAGNATVAAVENKSKYGILSSAFGQYHSSNIHFMAFEKGRLNITDTLPLDGYVYDTACSDDAILTAEVLPGGNSSVVEIFK